MCPTARACCAATPTTTRDVVIWVHGRRRTMMAFVAREARVRAAPSCCRRRGAQNRERWFGVSCTAAAVTAAAAGGRRSFSTQTPRWVGGAWRARAPLRFHECKNVVPCTRTPACASLHMNYTQGTSARACACATRNAKHRVHVQPIRTSIEDTMMMGTSMRWFGGGDASASVGAPVRSNSARRRKCSVTTQTHPAEVAHS